MTPKNREVFNKLVGYSDDARKWFAGKGQHFMRQLGVQSGFHILDFGCRIGHYVIPAAEVVAPNGIVYALDKDQASLDALLKNLKYLELDRLVTLIKTKGEVQIPLETNSIELVFLLDVIHIIVKNNSLKALDELLGEVHRVLKDDGHVVVSLTHIHELKYSRKELIEAFETRFKILKRLSTQIMHWNWLREENVLIFEKKNIFTSE